MLPVNRTSFKFVLHTSVGAAWYFHVIIVIIGHLILAGLAFYHYRVFEKSISQQQTTLFSSLCNPLSIHQCPAKICCVGTCFIALLAVLRSLYYCIGPYAISLKNPHFIFLEIVQILEYVCHAFHLTILTMLLFSQFLILVRAKSLNILIITPSSMDKKIFKFHRYLKLILVSFIVTAFVLLGALSITVFNNIKPILHLITGIWLAVLFLSSLYLIWIGKCHNLEIELNSFQFYSTSSSSSNQQISTESEAFKSRIYYECHSGLPRSMTKTSLNEFFVPNQFKSSNNNGDDGNHRQTSIHINDLEIVVEIEEPIIHSGNILESEIIFETKKTKRESLSTISSMKITTIDGEQGGYVADSEDNVKWEGKENKVTSVKKGILKQSDSLDSKDKLHKTNNLIMKKGNCDERLNIRQMIVADEYLKIFLSELKLLYIMIFTGLVLCFLIIYNGLGKYGALQNEQNRAVKGWGLWLIILSLFRLFQYLSVFIKLLLFRFILMKLGETIRKTEYMVMKHAQNRRGFRSGRRLKNHNQTLI